MTCGRELDREFNSYTNTMGKLHPHGFGAANFDAGRVAQYDVCDLSNCYLETYNVHLLEDYSRLSYCIQSADYPGLREGRHIVIDKPWNLTEYFRSGGNCWFGSCRSQGYQDRAGQWQSAHGQPGI